MRGQTLAARFNRTAISTEQLSIGAAAVSLASVPSNFEFAVMKLEQGPVRYFLDGTVPTAAVGIPAFDGEVEILTAPETRKFRGIRTGATNGLAWVTYYG